MIFNFPKMTQLDTIAASIYDEKLQKLEKKLSKSLNKKERELRCRLTLFKQNMAPVLKLKQKPAG